MTEAPLFAYLRVSRSQQDKSGLGLDFQREAIKRFADAEGLIIASEFVMPPELPMGHDIVARAAAEIAWSAERAATFYQTVIDEIGAESPECQRRILERLARVRGEAGERGFG